MCLSVFACIHMSSLLEELPPGVLCGWQCLPYLTLHARFSRHPRSLLEGCLALYMHTSRKYSWWCVLYAISCTLPHHMRRWRTCLDYQAPPPRNVGKEVCIREVDLQCTEFGWWKRTINFHNSMISCPCENIYNKIACVDYDLSMVGNKEILLQNLKNWFRCQGVCNNGAR